MTHQFQNFYLFVTDLDNTTFLCTSSSDLISIHIKMIIVLDSHHTEDLQFLKTVENDVIREFCNISLEFIRKGDNKKLYIAASKKLNVSPDVIENVVKGLSHLFVECSRFMLNDADFKDSLSILKFENELVDLLKEVYLEQRNEIRIILQELYPHFDHYSNLEWRLDVQVANRSLRGQTINPIYLLKLTTQSGGTQEKKEHILQTDPNNLKHLCNELEAALMEIRSNDCRRIMRNIK
ncbi:COMM domain-containing protein 2 [Heterostelium album PN500]|uniref:COMM domain-containing protein 2 n=1 Tax=Heterostelium pallidum (strain ATCC 26659 / Pp 5 / PN500) TaxID=670386 RepID=D3AXG8_HETP5|nr:COMM domain-containing protein 2 [Heterostelium album PN500]EFA86237.1 COMM domain-containing protein 2 [Heterostelium album PN500]|eukprot:XP_020438342.1 COMM domain-containing protein 2 [Heterostelium album PN500]